MKPNPKAKHFSNISDYLNAHWQELLSMSVESGPSEVRPPREGEQIIIVRIGDQRLAYPVKPLSLGTSAAEGGITSATSAH